MMLTHTRWVASLLFLFVSMLMFVDAAYTVFVFYAPDDNGQQREIYVMNDDGSHVRRLTHTPLWDTMPRWSPDGKRIVFERDVRSARGQQFDIFVMDADGSNEQRLLPELLQTLTPRERAVFNHLRGNQQNYEIAEALNLSESRVSRLVKQVILKVSQTGQRLGFVE